jgi:hypothetical protein
MASPGSSRRVKCLLQGRLPVGSAVYVERPGGRYFVRLVKATIPGNAFAGRQL